MKYVDSDLLFDVDLAESAISILGRLHPGFFSINWKQVQESPVFPARMDVRRCKATLELVTKRKCIVASPKTHTNMSRCRLRYEQWEHVYQFLVIAFYGLSVSDNDLIVLMCVDRDEGEPLCSHARYWLSEMRVAIIRDRHSLPHREPVTQSADKEALVITGNASRKK